MLFLGSRQTRLHPTHLPHWNAAEVAPTISSLVRSDATLRTYQYGPVVAREGGVQNRILPRVRSRPRGWQPTLQGKACSLFCCRNGGSVRGCAARHRGERRATALKRAPGKHTRRDERSGRSVGERPTFFAFFLASKEAPPFHLERKSHTATSPYRA